MSIKKYSNGAWSEVGYKKYGTETDTITTLPKTIIGDGQPITSYTIKGAMSQSGTPTPTNPIYPQETGDKTANLLNNYSIVQGGYMAAAGTVPTPMENPKRCRYNRFFSVTSNTVFYDSKDLNVNIVMMDSNGLSLGGSGFVTGAGSFTLLSNTEKISLIIANSDPTQDITPSDVRSKNISLDYGYKIPISSGGVTTNVYLGEVETTRKIEKLVLTGRENWNAVIDIGGVPLYYRLVIGEYNSVISNVAMCTHLVRTTITSSDSNIGFNVLNLSTQNAAMLPMRLTVGQSYDDFIAYLQQQYAAGTPVTVWYVLSTATTGIVNEPIRKIGDYADSVTGTGIPTTGTAEQFDVDTTLKPSEVSLTYHGWHEHQDTVFSE